MGTPVVVEVPQARPDVAVPQELPLTIVYEDTDLVVIDKAAGMVVHPGAGHPDGTLVNALLHTPSKVVKTLISTLKVISQAILNTGPKTI